MSKFKVGDYVVRTYEINHFKYGVEPLEIIEVDYDGYLKFKQDHPNSYGWSAMFFDLYQPEQPEVKPPEQSTQDRKLRLTELQKEAIQAGINALYQYQLSLENQGSDPSLTHCIEICKYQQEVLRSMLREVNR